MRVKSHKVNNIDLTEHFRHAQSALDAGGNWSATIANLKSIVEKVLTPTGCVRKDNASAHIAAFTRAQHVAIEFSEWQQKH